MKLTIKIDGLARVHVDAHGDQVVLEGHSMMMQHREGIFGRSVESNGRKVDVVLVLLLYFRVAQHHLGISASRVSCSPFLIRQINYHVLHLTLLNVGQERQLIVLTIPIEVV